MGVVVGGSDRTRVFSRKLGRRSGFGGRLLPLGARLAEDGARGGGGGGVGWRGVGWGGGEVGVWGARLAISRYIRAHLLLLRLVLGQYLVLVQPSLAVCRQQGQEGPCDPVLLSFLHSFITATAVDSLTSVPASPSLGKSRALGVLLEDPGVL